MPVGWSITQIWVKPSGIPQIWVNPQIWAITQNWGNHAQITQNWVLHLFLRVVIYLMTRTCPCYSGPNYGTSAGRCSVIWAAIACTVNWNMDIFRITLMIFFLLFWTSWWANKRVAANFIICDACNRIEIIMILMMIISFTYVFLALVIWYNIFLYTTSRITYCGTVMQKNDLGLGQYWVMKWPKGQLTIKSFCGILLF